MNKYGDESFITFLRTRREDADRDIRKGEILAAGYYLYKYKNNSKYYIFT